MDLLFRYTVFSKFKRLFFIFLCFLGCKETPVQHHSITLEESNFDIVTYGYFTRELNFETFSTEQVID